MRLQMCSIPRPAWACAAAGRQSASSTAAHRLRARAGIHRMRNSKTTMGLPAPVTAAESANPRIHAPWVPKARANRQLPHCAARRAQAFCLGVNWSELMELTALPTDSKMGMRVASSATWRVQSSWEELLAMMMTPSS